MLDEYCKRIGERLELMTDYYKDMEVVYKPAVQRLRDDMKRIRDLAQEIALLAASHDYPEIATPTPDLRTEDSASVATECSGASRAATDGCICKGNWRNIVKEYGHLIGRKYKYLGGKVFLFFGIVRSDDGYYFGMSRRGQLRLLSCVGSIEEFGFSLIDTGTEVTKGTAKSPHVQTDHCGFDRNSSHSLNTYVCDCGWMDSYTQVDLDHERKGD
jgi:hypothetical protein